MGAEKPPHKGKVLKACTEAHSRSTALALLLLLPLHLLALLALLPLAYLAMVGLNAMFEPTQMVPHMASSKITLASPTCHNIPIRVGINVVEHRHAKKTAMVVLGNGS